MSSPLFKTDLLFTQRILTASGLYSGPLDGKYSKQLEDAEAAFDTKYQNLTTLYGQFDPRTENTIYTLVPKAQALARQFMQVAGAGVKLISGTRTYAEQNVLFAKGRSTAGPRVTNARGGQSNHNFGIAWDCGIFDNGIYNEGRTAAQDAEYSALAVKIKAKLLPLEWGGDWKSITDKPHYQLITGKSISDVRRAFETGQPYI